MEGEGGERGRYMRRQSGGRGGMRERDGERERHMRRQRGGRVEGEGMIEGERGREGYI